jgi:hypothetical protein
MMKKALPLILIALALVATFAIASCAPANDSLLVGRWALAGSTTQLYEFTATTMTIGSGSGVSVTYDYSASAGAGKYWLHGVSIAKVDFTYTFSNSNDNMRIIIAGITTDVVRLD